MTSSVAPGRDARRLQGDDGANLIEYALLVSLIMLVAAVAVRFFQRETTDTFVRSASTIRDNTD